MRERLLIIGIALLSAVISMAAGLRWQWVRTWENLPREQGLKALSEFSSSHQVVNEFDTAFVTSRAHPELTATASLLPQTAAYNSHNLRAVYNYAKTCVDAPRVNDPTLAKALRWSKFICGQADAPDLKFFKTPPYIHPAGGTFAVRALSWKVLTLRALMPFLHRGEFASIDWRHDSSLTESERSIVAIIAAEDPNVIELLGNKTEWVVGPDFVFHRWQREDQDFYQMYNQSDWHEFWNRLPLEPRSPRVDENCESRYQGLCWKKSRHWLNRTAPIMAFTSVVLVSALALWILLLYLRRRRLRMTELQERLVLLQVLTHELRTPVTTMRLDTDVLRKESGNLSAPAQEAFLRMCSGLQRLMRALGASESYLGTFTRGGVVLDQKQKISSLNDFISSQAELAVNVLDDGSRIHVAPLSNDVGVELNAEIFGVCLRNLIQNALRHGSGKVSVSTKCSSDILTVLVSDEGKIDSKYLDRSMFKKPFQKSTSSEGLGLGLFLVSHFIDRLNGELTVTEAPTTFSISVPIRVTK